MVTRTEAALLVMVFNNGIREWLRANDPRALEQAFNALQAEGDETWKHRLVQIRRVHCNGSLCGPDGDYYSGCECKCGPCTARYGADGIWR